MARKRAARVERSGTIGLTDGKGDAAGKGFAEIAGFRGALAGAFVFCATLLAYWPALQGALLWDDDHHVTRPELQSLHGLWRIWFHLGATQQYYPLLHTAFWLEHRMWGDAALGYHLTNVALHAASACLVAVIVRRLSLPGAWLAGLVFALHPVCVESVAWISEQKSTLSGLFYLAAALAYLHFDQSRRRRLYFLATGLFAMALLSKSVTATLPAALLVVFWLQRGRLDFRRDALPLLPWFALGIPAGLFTAWVEKTFIGAEGSAYDLTVAQRLLLAGRAVWFYASKLIWPVNLTFSYPRWKLDPAAWWQYLYPAGVVALGVVLWLVARRARGPLAGFLVFVGTLFPALGFMNVFPFRFSWVADHFQYLASLGIIVPLASVVAVKAEKLGPGKLRVAAIPALLLAILGVLTWRQSGAYRDDQTLYRATLARNPDSWLAHHNLGAILVRIPGRAEEAIVESRAELRLEPGNAQSHYSLGNALAASGIPDRLPEAIAEFQAALRIRPDFPGAHNNLGNAFARMPGRLTDAVAEFRAALRSSPDLAATHANLGNVLADLGRLPEAVAEFEAALKIRPDVADFYYDLGIALSQMPGRLPDGIAAFQAALRIKPGDAETHFALGTALARTPGGLPGAMAELETTLRIRPDFEAAQEAMRQLRGIQVREHAR
jgi:tetratricopeptide (TPR) repeat protein